MAETVRARIITRRTYNRPKDNGSFESWNETIDRVVDHQRWLWRRARGRELGVSHEQELAELREILINRKGALAGRTYWLGGTEVARTRESSNFNCSGLRVETVHDVVDALWLLLQGCGVGAMPIAGTLNGFARPIQNIEVIPTTRTEAGGNEKNVESYNPETGEWRISVGDSAEAWAKSIGKLLAGKYPASKLILDFSQIRPAGLRLKGYGWVSSGGEAISKAYQRIAALLSQKAGSLLDRHDIHDILNWLGTILSTRRSSEIILYPYGDPGWQTFASFKKDFWLHDNHQRQQSNNSLVFWQKPTREQLNEVLRMMVESGGSEPGFINGEAASRKAPWFSTVNPCGEVLLGNKSFCNLVELNLMAFRNNPSGMYKAQTILARANYRQTCVNLRDGVLQSAWHENNEFLRLCGSGITGVMGRPDLTAYDYRVLRNYAIVGAYGMADELGLPRPKNCTLLKPSGCRPWNALTTTTAGILTLEEIFESHPEDVQWAKYKGNAKVIQGNKVKTITRTYVNGVAPVYRVKMNHGLIVESTSNHPWFVKQHYDKSRGEVNKYISINAWVETCSLKPDDIIEVVLGTYNITTHSLFKSLNSVSIKMRGDAVEIKQPISMTEDIGWLLGYLWGDGAMSPDKYRIRFIDQHIQHLQKAKRIMAEQFGVTANITKASGHRNAFTFDVASKMLWHWLIKNGVYKYDADRLDLIPLVVRSSARNDIIAFIAGLIDSDGCVSIQKENKRAITIATADERFGRHVQDVCWTVGLGIGMSHNTVGQNLQKRKSMYLMTMNGYANENAFAILREHSEKIRRSDKTCSYPFSHESVSVNKSIVGKVISVELIGEMQTYDIEVADNHWFYAGAVRSHNTISKIMGTEEWGEVPEGCHMPPGRYVFNNVKFGSHDPLVPKMEKAGYKIFKSPNPTDTDTVIACLPTKYDTVKFSIVDGREMNNESAVAQLERYKMLMQNYVDHNCSITVSYTPDEIVSITDWIDRNWDSYVGVSFIPRIDHTKSAADLGYPYLPQEVVTKEMYDKYSKSLKPLNIDKDTGTDLIDTECEGGACPVR